MSSLLRREAFACEEVDYPTAIAYLRKEAVTLSGTAPRGFYPQEWRIRSGYLPEEIRIL